MSATIDADRKSATGERSSAPAAAPPPAVDEHALYLNPELGWLAACRRLLHEAKRPHLPLLERVRLVADYSERLDAFFLHRVGPLRQRGARGELSIDGRSAGQQIAACHDRVHALIADEAVIVAELRAELERADIRLARPGELDKRQQASLAGRVTEHILPLLTPVALMPHRPLPQFPNLGLALLIDAHDASTDSQRALCIALPLPARVPRFLRVDDALFVALEDAVAAHIGALAPGLDVRGCSAFRLTRASLAPGEREPGPAPPTRLETTVDMPARLRGVLATGLRLTSREDVFQVASLLGAGDLRQLASLPRADLSFPAHHPVTHPRLRHGEPVFDEVLRHGPMLLRHPYQCLDSSVVHAVEQAAADASVLAIKLTLPDGDAGARTVTRLAEAVSRGCQVTIVLPARRGRAQPGHGAIRRRLEQAGAMVCIDASGGRRCPSLVLLLRSRAGGAFERLAWIGGGDNPLTSPERSSEARLLSADDDVTREVADLFNLMTSGSASRRRFTQLLVAPGALKAALIARIQRERLRHERHGDGCIRIQCVTLDDPQIARALYVAARAGVTIDLIVRDGCVVRPGVPGLSESLRVLSIVGRYAENDRVYYFHNGGQDEYLFGTVDPSPRSLARGVAALLPVTGAARDELAELFWLRLSEDNGAAWEMDASGDYRRVSTSEQDSQTRQVALAPRSA